MQHYCKSHRTYHHQLQHNESPIKIVELRTNSLADTEKKNINLEKLWKREGISSNIFYAIYLVPSERKLEQFWSNKESISEKQCGEKAFVQLGQFYRFSFRSAWRDRESSSPWTTCWGWYQIINLNVGRVSFRATKLGIASGDVANDSDTKWMMTQQS